jgi:hypothetical protein
MGTFLKQSEVEGPKKKKGVAKGKRNGDADAVKVVVSGSDDSHMRTPSMQHDINYVSGLGGIEESLDWIARGISKLTCDEHSISLSTGYGTDPVKLTLCPNDYDDTLDRLVTAVERIADSLARLAGLDRPRLELWHEQEEYTPRYKETACDGGAPGPKADAT